MNDDPHRVIGRGEDPGRADDRGDETPARPRVFIPWGLDDDGIRGPANTIAPWVVPYLWPGVHVVLPDGSPYTGGKLPRYQTSTIVIDVANSGADGVYVEASAYWADPSAGFGPPHLNRGPVVGHTAGVWVPPYTTVQAPPITLEPDGDTPDHFCLIAVVSGGTSVPDGSWNPLSDGHYAQHNLDVVPADDSGQVVFPVQLVNPFDVDATVEVKIRSAGREQLQWFADQYRCAPAHLPVQALRLLAVGDDNHTDRPNGSLRLPLAGRERRICQAVVSTERLEPGEFSAIEVRSSFAAGEGRRRGERGAEGCFGVVVVRN